MLAARKKSGITRGRFAALTGVSYGLIRRVELGETAPSGTLMIRGADVLNISIDNYIGHTVCRCS